MDLKFEDFILDNIHGYIALTEIECKIETLPIFRRLRGIKQLGLTNWIFPGAEHTRYSHSLGVMHIADKMAQKLDFTLKERQFIRVCGMLHDIGHYPLSHVGERAYRWHYSKDSKNYHNPLYYADELSKPDEAHESIITDVLIKKSENPFHHELISEAAIRASSGLKELFSKYDIDIDDVCAIITGNITKTEHIKFVQILHSELDADRIDYLLRDTFSSGTAYGAFEINSLIKSLEMARHKYFDVDIMGVNFKGILSADQFLINRYFAYKQVFLHKNVIITSLMSEMIMLELLNTEGFPSHDTLIDWINTHESNDNFFNFTDSFFIEAIKRHRENENTLINKMINNIIHYTIPELAHPKEKHNIIISGTNNEEILSNMKNCGVLGVDLKENQIMKIDRIFLTEHIKSENFRRVYENFSLEHSLETYELHRLVNGISYIDDSGEISLLLDTQSSLIKDLCRHKTLFLRTYTIE